MNVPSGDVGQPPALSFVHRSLPQAAAVSDGADAGGFWTITNTDGNVIAKVARTLPAASDAIGYRGPSEAIVIVDDQWHIIAVDLLGSADTDEHVQAVRDDTTFFEQFVGWQWENASSNRQVDAVSGATLTSLALAEGVLKRMGDDRPSLVFPTPFSDQEIHAAFPDGIVSKETQGAIQSRDVGENTLGTLLRTGPLVDDIVGYQGPTELTIKLSETQTIEKIRIRSSMDNEPYVGYFRTEAGFWAHFEDQTIEQLSTMDVQEAGVEGVSGATMTSMAVADTLVEAAKKHVAAIALREQHNEAGSSWLEQLADIAKSIRFTLADGACVTVLLVAALFRWRGWFRARILRVVWLLTVVIVIGLWSGNLISLALLAGWGAEGIAWRLAPALAAIAAVAIVSPPARKSNPYCNHLCPHGAIQQLIRPGSKSHRRIKVPPRLLRVLGFLPGSMLVTGYVLLLSRPTTDLSSWEPFHAYLFRVAPWTAFALAAVTLAVSAIIPMGYCRLGCPTGRLLDYLRRTANSDQIRLADITAVCLLVLAILLR